MADEYPRALKQALMEALKEAGVPPGTDVTLSNQTFGETTIEMRNPADD